jgi:hypothetical protein
MKISKIMLSVAKRLLPGILLATAVFGSFPADLISNTQIRQEINILDAALSGSSGAFATSSEIALLDSTQYSSGTYYFEVDASTTSAFTGTISLVNATSGTAIASVSINGTAFARYRSSSFAAPGVATEYKVQAGNEAVGKKIIAARIVILQNATTLTNTETDIEIGNNEILTSTATSTLASPKYWSYNSSKWDGSPTFAAEVTYQLLAGVASSTAYNTAGTYTVTLPPSTASTSIQLIGGGGAGGGVGAATTGGGAGGAGGQFAQSTTTTAGTRTHTLVVADVQAGTSGAAGSNGNDSTWDTTIVVAKGGTGGGLATGAIVASSTGSTTGCVGTICRAGGSGAAGTLAIGGVGGGGAGTNAAGSSATSTSTTLATAQGGGAGGAKTVASGTGASGSTAGGAGGGAFRSNAGARIGGTGAQGRATTTSIVASTTIALQEDNGAFGSWTDKVYLVTTSSAGAGTSTRVRTAFTAVNGKHYRIAYRVHDARDVIAIYNAKIIVDQTSPSLLEPQYLLSSTKLVAGTGLQGYLTSWLSTEWNTVNTYIHQMDAAASSASVAGVYTSGGVLVTGSTVTSPNNSATSSSLTMPANGDLDVKATTNNNDVYANRILVDTAIRPDDVSSATVTAGDTQNSLAWTNPSGSLSTVMVVASTSAITFTPTDSTTYSTSTLSGASRVACYGLQASCIDTSLSNGTAYNYKIFVLGTNGYWSTPGVTPTGSPATPITQTYTEQAYKLFQATSTNDGIVWTRRTSAADNSWRSVAYGNGVFVAVSMDGTNRVMRSTDGVTWATQSAAEANQWRSVTYGNGLFVAVADSGTHRVMTSPDGITWTAQTAASASLWFNVAYGNGVFVALSVGLEGAATEVMTSSNGVTWTSHTASSNSVWTAVTYGNGLFVAVSSGLEGVANEVMTSPDGSTWTAHTAAANNEWYSIAYGDGLFVAVSDTGTGNRVMTSPDGTTWTSRTSASDNVWLAVTYGNGNFVAVSFDDTGAVMTSPDGVTWTARTAADANNWRSVTYGNGMWVAVSTDGSGNRVMTSSTFGPHSGLPLAATSTTATLTSSGQSFRLRLLNRVDSVALSANSGKSFKLQYAAKSGTCDTSFSGETYADITSTTPIAWYDNPDFTNGSTTTATSSDPIDSGRTVRYEQYREDNNFTNPTAIASGETGLWDFSLADNGAVAGTSYCIRAVKSTDATTWTARTATANITWTSVAYGNGTFVAVATGGTTANDVMRSTDGGATWTSSGLTGVPGIGWASVTFGNGTFAAVSSSAGAANTEVMTSSDGITWTARTSPTVSSWQKITYGASAGFVAIDENRNYMTSLDGTTWTASSGGSNSSFGLAYGNGLYVAVQFSGTGNRAVTSPDGVTWTNRTTPEDNTWVDVTYGNGLFVAVAQDGTHRVMTSPNGIIWTAQTAADNTVAWESVSYGNGLFVAVSTSGGKVMTSPDGITWTLITTGVPSFWWESTYGGGVFVAISNGTEGVASELMTSPIGGTTLDTYTVVPEITIATVAASTAVGDATDPSNQTLAPSASATSTDAFTLQTTSGTDAVTAVTVSLGSGAHSGLQYVEITDSLGNYVYGTSTAPSSDTPSITTTNLTANTTLTTYKIRITPLSHANMPAVPGASYTVNASTTAITSSNTKTYADVAGTTITIDNNSPANVTSATATAGDAQVAFTWTASPLSGDVAKFMVLRGTASISDTPVEGSTYATSSTIGATTVACYGYQVSCTDTGVTGQGSTYYYKVFALDTSGNWSTGFTPTGSPASTATSTYTQQAYKFFQATSSYDGANWTLRSTAANNSWKSVTYGTSTFVAVSSSGVGNRVMTSPDGVTWTSQISSEDNSWQSVTYGNGLFVAVAQSGTHRVMTSPDGINWTNQTAAEANSWKSVAYGNGLFVAVASDGTHQVMTSNDGVTWTPQTAGNSASWHGVTYGNGTFVAVAPTTGGSGAMTSTDGAAWVSRSTSGLNGGESLAYGNGKFVAVNDFSNNKPVMVSTDGATWTGSNSTDAASWFSVTFGNGMFVSTDIDDTPNSVEISTDGLNWTRIATPIQTWFSVTYGNGKFVAVSSDAAGGTLAMTSGTTGPHPGDALVATSTAVTLYSTGQQFRLRMLNRVDTANLAQNSGKSYKLQYAVKSGTCDSAFSGETYADITDSTPISWYDNSAFHNRDTAISTSTDPVDGSRVVNYESYNEDNNFSNPAAITNGQNGLWDLSLYDNGATGSTSYCIREVLSTDAQTWITRTPSADNSWNDVAYGNSTYVAIGGTSGSANQVMTSSNGITWTAQSSADSMVWRTVTYGNGLFVAGASSASGGSHYIMTSPDGLTWTNQTSGLSGDAIFSITYGNGVYVAVSSLGTVMSSPDAAIWTSRTAAAASTWVGVAYGNGLFVAVSESGTVMTSPNGINWTSRTAAAANNWEDVVYGNGLFVAVGSTGTNRVMTSPDGITWTVRTPASDTWHSVTYGNGLFVATAWDGAVTTSPDGVTWTTQTAASANEWRGVTYGNGLFVAVADSGTNRIMTASTSASTFSSYGSGSGSFSYARAITFDHTKVDTNDQTNFPIVVNGVYSYLKTVGNGGKVQNSSGYDVGFYSDSACSSALSWETVRYVASTGEVEYWVKIPSLSHITDTTIYMCYGNSSISSDQSNKNSVWTGNYEEVWHVPDGSSLSLSDSTSNNQTLSNTASVAAGEGKIDGGAAFNANNYLDNAGGIANYTTGDFSVSYWIKYNSFSSGVIGQGPVTVYKGQYQTNGWYSQTDADGKVNFSTSQSGVNQNTSTASGAVTTGNWYYVTFTRTGSSVRTYINGTDATNVAGTHINPTSSSDNLAWGVYAPGVSGVKFDGNLDEMRISSVKLTSDWIKTQYNNQSATSTFYTVQSEVTPGGYSYYRAVTIDHTKVPNTDQTNFPVLVSGTNSYLATVANGGKVQNSNGYDIGFFSNSSCSTKLDWEQEKYLSTNGEIEYWVEVPTLSHTADTVIYLCYGNAAVTTDLSNKAGVWDSNFQGVYHMADGTTLSGTDSTGVGNNGTLSNAPTATTGQIDGAGNFASTSSQSIGLGTSATLNPSAITYSAWIKATSFPNSYNSIVSKVSGPVNPTFSQMFVRSSGKLAMYASTTNSVPLAALYDGTGANTLSAGTWYMVTMTYDTATGLKGYLNGSVDGSDASTIGRNLASNTGATTIGIDTATDGRAWNGAIDEVEISNVVRSSDWITTEYNNQSATSTFYSLGSENSGSGVSTIAEVVTATNNSYITQLHYRWRNDDGTESAATYAAAEDTALSTGVYVGDRKRLRFVLSGTGPATGYTYQLEQASSSCTSWIAVPNAATNGTHWVADISQYFLDGGATTNSASLTDPSSSSFVAGYMKAGSALTSSHTLANAQFTEHEFTIKSTSSVTPSTTYCFRVTNAGDATKFTYTQTPQISVRPNSARPVGGGSGVEGNGTGPVINGGNQGGGGSGTSGNAGGEGNGSGGSRGGGNEGGGGAGGGDTGFLLIPRLFVMRFSPFFSVIPYKLPW